MRDHARSLLLLLTVSSACSDSAFGPDRDGGADQNTDGDADLDADADSDADSDGDSDADADADVSDGGASLDGGSSEPDASIPDDRIPIFIAQGMVGRSTISCDDGHSWVGDRSWDREDEPLLCGSTDIVCDVSSCSQRWYDGSCGEETPCDCGHSPGFSKGVAYDGDQFVATWGWGWPGSVRRSRNGIDWEPTLADNSFGGIAYGAGRFVLGGRDNFWSANGVDWTAGETADFSGPNEPVIWSVRRFGFADYDGGRFIAVASGNTDLDILVSSDGGESWWRPSVIPPGCGNEVGSYGGILYGNGVIALIGGNGACSSTDGGDTWTMTGITEGDELFVATPVFTGTEFWAWTHYGHVLYRSEDAVSWTGTPMVTETGLGAVAISPATGTLVAVSSVWLGYGDMEFLRSSDGLTWESLPAGTFAPGHPIFHIAFGYAERSEVCP